MSNIPTSTSTPNLTISVCVGDKFANVMNVYINNVLYEYRPKADVESTIRKVRTMMSVSHGKALQWIKNYCQYIGKVE